MPPFELARKLRAGETVFTAWCNLGSPVVAETIAREGYACAVLDRQHGLWDTASTIAGIVGIPVFFQVGFVLLIPLMFLLAKQTRTPVLYIGVPLLAGLSVMHGLVPPHPGPMAAIEVLKANVGKTIFYALLIGFPTAVVAGPLMAKESANGACPSLSDTNVALSWEAVTVYFMKP